MKKNTNKDPEREFWDQRAKARRGLRRAAVQAEHFTGEDLVGEILAGMVEAEGNLRTTAMQLRFAIQEYQEHLGAEPALIEPGIAPIVTLLQQHGFETFTSCEGGPGHPHAHAEVGIRPGGEAEETRGGVAALLLERGYRNFETSITHRCGEDGEPPQWSPAVWLRFDGASPEPAAKPKRSRGAPKKEEAGAQETVIRKLAATKGLGEAWIRRALAEVAQRHGERVSDETTTRTSGAPKARERGGQKARAGTPEQKGRRA